MKETYQINLPKRIVVGDPWYFERYAGRELENLVVRCTPPTHFAARIVLEEKPLEEYPDMIQRTMAIYLAPEQTIETYLQEMMYESQKQIIKDIGVDTAKYLLQVNEKELMIYTGGDGYWGDYQELFRKIERQKILDAVIITLVIPEFESFQSMRDKMNFLFDGIEKIENVEEPDLTEEVPENEIGICP